MIRYRRLYQADLSVAVGPEPLKVSEHNDLRETFTKLRRVPWRCKINSVFLQTWQLGDEVQQVE